MSPAPQPTSKPARAPSTLIGVGVLIVALGFGLPMLTSGPAPEKASPAKEELTESESGRPAPVAPPSATGLGAALARLAVGLAIVCGLCVLAARWLAHKPAAGAGAMEVLASIQVARCAVHLVRAGERRLLVGTDPGGVKSLLELPGPDPALPPPEVAAATAPPAPDPAPAPPAPAPPTREEVAALLAKLLARPAAPPPA